MSTGLVSAVNKAAAEMRATFGKIVSKSLSKIPSLLQDEARRLATEKMVFDEVEDALIAARRNRRFRAVSRLGTKRA